MTINKIIAPFGTWKSPITANMIADTTIALVAVLVDGADIYWLEARPSEGGRVVLVRWTDEGPEDVLAPGYSARSLVHEYGGGAATVSSGTVFFVNFADQRIYRILPGAEPYPLTADNDDRYADMFHDASRDCLICVRERHAGDAVTNEIVAVDLVSGAPQTLVAGHDFVSNPRVSPDGQNLCWVGWDLPDMPWDAATLWVAPFEHDGSLGKPLRVAGGDGVSVFQPIWAPDGTLLFSADPEGWWNLHRWDGNQLTIVHAMAAEFGLPQWNFGMRTTDVDDAGLIVTTYTSDGVWYLAQIGALGLRAFDLPYTEISAPQWVGDKLVFIGASPRQAASLVVFDPISGNTDVLRNAMSVDLDLNNFSVPESVCFDTAGGGVAHGFYYPPHSASHAPAAGEIPPLIVRGHGGPTGVTVSTLSLAIQYWTSRGFAVLDVNYRGSTGFGRGYREALYGGWGKTDVEDMAHGAEYLVAAGKADPSRLAIRGGSAGGYTALAALVFCNTFSAGASLYGIGNLMTLARDTHKFESRYLDLLIGPLPETEQLYRDRSPIAHVDKFNCPVIFLQGSEDRVVPPNQAEAMVDALEERGIPVAYVLFENEGHGFRKAENVCRALECELAFYGRVFGFEPADELQYLNIRNL
ncbi:MAG: peptidase [Alphaproteobacteria bacterium]|nr:peptidase [Alphaproteobacteria bacterium]HCP00843.1 peptidase [Rhodospirillaceae bacterium]